EVGYDDEPADASSADEPSADDRLADRVGDAASADSQIHVPGPAPEKFGDDPRARQAAVRRSSVARRSGFAALVVLGIAASVVGARFLLGGDGDGDVDPPTIAARPERSVAVLPFVSISSEPDQDYFSDGISEELLNVLSNVRGLRVPSRTSSFAFKGTNADLKTIAEALDVEHILEGSVRKAGDHVRITAQ